MPINLTTVTASQREDYPTYNKKKGLLYNGYGVFPGSKVRPGRDADPSPLSSAEVKNRVQLYLYSP